MKETAAEGSAELMAEDDECVQNPQTTEIQDIIRSEIKDNIGNIWTYLKDNVTTIDSELPEALDELEQVQFLMQLLEESGRPMQEVLLHALQRLELNKGVDALEELMQIGQDKTECTDFHELLKQESPEPTSAAVTSRESPPLPVARPYAHVLKDAHGTFVDTMLLSSTLLDHLQTHSVFTLEMANKIMCRANRADKVRDLIGFLMHLGPESLTVFIEALRITKQVHLANILDAETFA